MDSTKAQTYGTQPGNQSMGKATSGPAAKLNADQIKTFREKADGIYTVMLTTTTPDGEYHIRPMATQQIDDDGCLWFFTSRSSEKIKEINGEHDVAVTYTNSGSELYLVAYGKGQQVDNRAKIDELWSEYVKAWFPEGKDDPDLTLLKVQVTGAEYWDTPGGKIASIIGIAKAYITGTHDNSTRNEKIGDAV